MDSCGPHSPKGNGCGFEKVKTASEGFDAITREAPSGLPHPDTTAHSYREYSAARQNLMIAMHRLNDLVIYGAVPTIWIEPDHKPRKRMPQLRPGQDAVEL